jgi:hypothetical protein
MTHQKQFIRWISPLVTAYALVLGSASVGLLLGQGKGNAKLLIRELMPPQFRQAVTALGERAWKPGNEREVQIGAFVKGGQQKTIRVTRELPNLLRLEDAGPGGRAVVFDGHSPGATDRLSEDDQDTAESLGEDSAESILYNVQTGYSLRFLGGRFRTDRGAMPNYRGPWLDIFEVAGAAKTRAATSVRQKQVVFDSDTQQLLYVRYKILRGSQTILVQTEWGGWTRVNGYAVPARVARRENGVEVWSFTQNQVSIGPAQDDNAFVHN